MKFHRTLAVSALSLAMAAGMGVAHADDDDGTSYAQQAPMSSLTRAEVQAQIQPGYVDAFNGGWRTSHADVGENSRATVREEAIVANQRNEVPLGEVTTAPM